MTTTIYDYFAADWLAGAKMETSYQTEITASSDGLAEERSALRDRPLRTFTYKWLGLSTDMAHRMVMAIMRAAGQRILLPIFQDASTVVNLPAEVWVDDVAGRRYKPALGGQIIFYREADAAITKVLVTTISDLSNIGLSPPRFSIPGGPPPAIQIGDKVAPLAVVEVNLNHDITIVTDNKVDLSITFEEAFSVYTFPASVDAGSTAGMATFDAGLGNYPIFDAENADWKNNLKLSVARGGEVYRRGLASVVYPRGPRASFGYTLQFLTTTKAEFEKLLNFFDSRRGKLNPFWLASPLAPWVPSNLTTTRFDILATGTLQDITDFVPFIAVVMNDGTIYIRQRSTVVDNGDGTWRVNLSTTLPALSLTDVRRITYGHLVRFTSDTFAEEWDTDSVCRVALGVVELFNEFNLTGI